MKCLRVTKRERAKSRFVEEIETVFECENKIVVNVELFYNAVLVVDAASAA